MIYHCIRFSVKPDADPQEVATALGRMAEATSQITTATPLVFGPDIGGEYDYAGISTVETLEEYETMMNHPAHLEVDRIGLPLVDKFVSYDVTDDPDPAVAAKIAAIHQRRYENEPDIADLVGGLEDYTGSAAPAGAEPTS
ncbi:Dabb family protein [Nesterenkonia haasae]|uniref:Dabb family protein n=1 Tax=Nesterenkonia haasae TaxID=2587813 RepID=UPI001391115C|nr:Dabb family protein [Nesterenkonia haasae]NDK32777.1 Dabb family protein [Nesterenkonia haasae]